MSEPCGCLLENGELKTQCKYHKTRDILIVSRTALYLEAKLKALFVDNHLHELRDQVLNCVRNLRKK